uniref:Eukaryotic elongation factor 2 kinase n=1 Tax=Cavia porcellus TaxID=10141 RepID=A0A286XIN1_CAVPO
RDSETSGDSGFPSERRGELDDPEPQDHGHLNGRRRSESDEDSLGSAGRETEKNKTKGFNYLLKAAKAGDRQSMILVARAFDTGQNLSPDRCQDWPEALHWYNTALETTDCDEGGEFDGMQHEPRYALLAREAEMLLTGGCGLEKDPQRSGDLYTQAAEAAMEAMKGRLANQYYEKAEEAWAQMEE